MKLRYNKIDDVLMISLNDKKIDYAEQTGDLIVHFSPQREAVLLEILDASKFLKQTAKAFPAKVKNEILGSSAVAHRIRK